MNKRYLIFGAIACIALLFFLICFIFHTQPDTKNKNNSVYPGGVVIYSFGEAPLTPQNMTMDNYDDWFSRLRQVTIDSDKDLDNYYYPNGPVIGHGYDLYGTMDIQINKDWKVNQSVITEIYQVIERNGEKNGIKNIPCKFLSMGLLRNE